MTNPRQQNLRTATILGILMLGVGGWLWARGAAEAAPTDIATSNSPRLETATEPGLTETGSAQKTASEPSREPEVAAEYEAPISRGPATIEIHVHFFPTETAEGEERTVGFRAISEKSDRVVGQSKCRSRGIEAVGYLDVPPNQWNHIEAVVAGAHVPGRRLHLGPGERYRIDLECGANLTRLRVVGPSAELAPYLRLEVHDLGAETIVPFELPLGKDGTVACHFHGHARASVVLTGRRRLDQLVPMRTHPGKYDFDTSPNVIELVPIQQLLGIIVSHQRRPIAAAISLRGNRPDRTPVVCSVTTMTVAKAAETIQILTEAGSHQRGPIDRVKQAGDLWTVATESLNVLSELRVTFTIPEMTTRAVPLMAIPLTESAGTQLENTKDNRVQRALLPVGDYRLAWAPHGVPGETAANLVRIEAGKATMLQLVPRLLELWTVNLRDAPEHVSLSLGWASDYLGHSTTGSFSVGFERPPVIGEAAWIVARHAHAAFPATFVSVDPAAHRAEVTSRLAEAQESILTLVQLEGGRIRSHLLPHPDYPVAGGIIFGQVLMLPGTVRHGFVIEIINRQEQLTRWFEISAGTDELTLTPNGRWVTLTFPRPTPRADVIIEGPTGPSTGNPARLRINAMERSIPLYVAEGTSAIHVEVGGVRQTFDPRLTEFVVR